MRYAAVGLMAETDSEAISVCFQVCPPEGLEITSDRGGSAEATIALRYRTPADAARVAERAAKRFFNVFHTANLVTITL